jgi:uncharacterized Ntn-hydrolase superfamily protein
MKYQETILSIVAADLKAGDFGVAVASASLAVGKNVPFTGAFVGAMAVQGYVGPFFGIAGMKLLREGLSAERVIESVTSDDLLRDSRQILVVDAAGRTAAVSGSNLSAFSGVKQGEHYVVGGCGLDAESNLAAASGAFEAASGDLPGRLLEALLVFEREHRGLPLESAALRVSRNDPFPFVDLRIDSAREPVKRLVGLLATWRSQQPSAAK